LKIKNQEGKLKFKNTRAIRAQLVFVAFTIWTEAQKNIRNIYKRIIIIMSTFEEEKK